MIRQYRIDYGKCRDCFRDYAHITSELIWGDPNFIKSPWLSYVIPVYRRADLLRYTLESIFMQWPVDFDWDIVVVDNECGGENDTERLIRELGDKRILYYRNHENIGVDSNYNRCIELARGKWLAMVHGDDLLVEDHLYLMGKYIREKEQGRKPLAYISPAYQSFKDASKISLKRPAGLEDAKTEKERANVRTRYNTTGVLRFYQIDALFRGYSVSLPSFGTVMNRQVMLETGGFDQTLGTCEDVITPYKLAKHYRVYETSLVMGYYRFDRSETVKSSSIFKICESMSDFHEYLYSRTLLSRLWGHFARSVQFHALLQQCTTTSRLGERKLVESDFEYLQKVPRSPQGRKVDEWVVKHVMDLYVRLRGMKRFEEGLDALVDILYPKLHVTKKDKVIVYGAGRAGICVRRALRKRYGISTECFIVSSMQDNRRQVDGVPVFRADDERIPREGCPVIIATITPDYHDEMMSNAQKFGYKDVVTLCQYQEEAT
ncbi:MAG: glycosyltransferase [Oscillibacter sp.]|jgi:glycosyltransferase involved in cell wall biosynthesis|nr:glycosyltransferase [Oscillibacter sp.]